MNPPERKVRPRLSLGIRKVIVIGLVAGVFLMANARVIAGWLADRGLVDWAASIRRESLI